MQGGLPLMVDGIGIGSLPHQQAQDVPGGPPDRQVDTGVPLTVKHTRLVITVTAVEAWRALTANRAFVTNLMELGPKEKSHAQVKSISV